MKRLAWSALVAFAVLAGCTDGPSAIEGTRVFEERAGAWPKLSKVTLCDNDRFSIQTAVEVNTDVGTFVQDAPADDRLTGTATGTSTTSPAEPIAFHYAISFGSPNVLTSVELGGSWEQLGDATSLDRAAATCELVAAFELP